VARRDFLMCATASKPVQRRQSLSRLNDLGAWRRTAAYPQVRRRFAADTSGKLSSPTAEAVIYPTLVRPGGSRQHALPANRRAGETTARWTGGSASGHAVYTEGAPGRKSPRKMLADLEKEDGGTSFPTSTQTREEPVVLAVEDAETC